MKEKTVLPPTPLPSGTATKETKKRKTPTNPSPSFKSPTVESIASTSPHSEPTVTEASSSASSRQRLAELQSEATNLKHEADSLGGKSLVAIRTYIMSALKFLEWSHGWEVLPPEKEKEKEKEKEHLSRALEGYASTSVFVENICRLLSTLQLSQHKHLHSATPRESLERESIDLFHSLCLRLRAVMDIRFFLLNSMDVHGGILKCKDSLKQVSPTDSSLQLTALLKARKCLQQSEAIIRGLMEWKQAGELWKAQSCSLDLLTVSPLQIIGYTRQMLREFDRKQAVKTV